MALKEGRCVNCGSILFLDPKNEKGHCLFCDAVFLNSEAFRAEQDPGSFAFPNEEQPPYDGPNLDPRPQMAAAAPVARPTVKKETVPAFVPTVNAIPDAKIPKKAKIIAITALVVILAVFTAVFLPLTLNRDKYRTAITESFSESLDPAVDVTTSLSIINLDNSFVQLALPSGIAEAEAESLFDTFVEVRAQAMNLTGDNVAEGVEMEVVTPEGGYRISVEKGERSTVAFD